MKNAGTILMYNCSGPEFSKLRQIFAMLHMRMRVVTPDRYHLSLMELYGGKGENLPEDQAPTAFEERMLVFCNLNQSLLHQVLNVIRLAELPEIQLKAMLTATNKVWNSVQLRDELLAERAALAKAAQEAEEKKAAEAAESEAEKPAETEEAKAED